MANLSTLFTGGNPTNLLLGKMSEFEYTVQDILKGSESARCVLEFYHKDGTSGTIEIKMIKEDKEWKIDGLINPQFDKIVWPAKES